MHHYRKKKKKKAHWKIFRNKFGWNDLESPPPRSTHFFSSPPTKNRGGMRDHVRANLKSSWAKFHVSQGTGGIYFNCDLLCEVKFRGSGCTYAPSANAIRRSTFVSIPKKGGRQWIRTRHCPLIIIHLNKPRIFIPGGGRILSPRWREDLRN